MANHTLQDDSHCTSCGASLKKYTYTLTPALVDVLEIMFDQVRQNGVNRFNQEQMRDKLKTYQYTQITKLRFFGLVAKEKIDGTHTGYWILTSRAGKFLKGDHLVPKRVTTFRNKIVSRSEELTDYKEVTGQVPYIETKDLIKVGLATAEDRTMAVELAQTAIF